MTPESDSTKLHQRAIPESNTKMTLGEHVRARPRCLNAFHFFKNKLKYRCLRFCNIQLQVLGKCLGQFFSQVLIESKIESILVKICSKQWSKSRMFKVSFSPNFQCEVDISGQEKGMCGWKSGPLWTITALYFVPIVTISAPCTLLCVHCED